MTALRLSLMLIFPETINAPVPAVGAVVQFEAVLALDPGDGPSRVYLERAKEYFMAPPPENWDGVYELKSK